MKKSFLLISLFIISITSYALTGQSHLVLSSSNLGTTITKEVLKKAPVKDNSAITQISNHLKKNSNFTLDRFKFVNELRVEVQVDISETGELTDYKVLNYKDPEITTPITDALSTIKTVSPIISNGHVKSQRVIIPIIIKS